MLLILYAITVVSMDESISCVKHIVIAGWIRQRNALSGRKWNSRDICEYKMQIVNVLYHLFLSIRWNLLAKDNLIFASLIVRKSSIVFLYIPQWFMVSAGFWTRVSLHVYRETMMMIDEYSLYSKSELY